MQENEGKRLGMQYACRHSLIVGHMEGADLTFPDINTTEEVEVKFHIAKRYLLLLM